MQHSIAMQLLFPNPYVPSPVDQATSAVPSGSVDTSPVPILSDCQQPISDKNRCTLAELRFSFG